MGKPVSGCAVTVTLVKEDKIGFIRRAMDDTYPGLLTPPGGKVEMQDGTFCYDDIPYYSLEGAAVREVIEEAGIVIDPNRLKYFCSLTLPNGRVIVSFYYLIDGTELTRSDFESNIVWLSFFDLDKGLLVPGMVDEMKLLKKIIEGL